ncbi:hypothetical protein ACFQH6_02265 [Halobacteriaceae archaeon GCM10025711]
MNENDDDHPAAADPRENPNVEAMTAWDAVVADMEATAAEYEEEGWETLQIHPGDATVVNQEDRAGLDVLVPNNEYEALEELMEAGVAFDEYQVFRAVESGMVYLLVVMQDTDVEVAVLFPTYYRIDEAGDLFDRARREGVLHSYLRILSGEYVELTHSDPSLFAPPED